MLFYRYYLVFFIAFITTIETSGRESFTTVASSQLNAMAQHAETVYFMDGIALKQGTDLYRALCMPIGVLAVGIEKIPLKEELFDEKLDLVNERIGWVLIGAKDFRLPKSKGVIMSRRVYLIKFLQPKRLDFDKLVGSAPRAKIQNRPVYEWKRYEEESKEMLHFVIVQTTDTEIWVGTDLEFLQEVLGSGTTDNSVVESRAEWKEVSLSSPVWGVRRYRHEGVKDRIASGLLLAGPDGRPIRLNRTSLALTFFYDEPRGNAVLRYLTSSHDGLLRFWRTLRKVDVTKIGPGRWQLTIATREDNYYFENTAMALGFMGFGLAL